jgi:hypothetical protein
MKMVEAREFTTEGLAVFKAWLDRAEQVRRDPNDI